MNTNTPQMETENIQKEIITQFETRDDFFKLLNVNQGIIIIDLNATWCKPCQKIQPLVDAFFASSPQNVICCSLDVDENFDLYALLKSKRMVNGIPALLCYIRGNTSIVPDFSHTGSDPTELDAFFRKCGNVEIATRSPYTL